MANFSDGGFYTLSDQSQINTREPSEEDSTSDADELEEEFFDREKIKKKFLSAWNNVKYGFNVQYKPSFNTELPIWLLGRCYHSRSLELTSDNREIQERLKVLSIDQFFEDFNSLIWLTYRKKFSQLANSNLTSDGGWGCMLRTGQMLLANAMLIHMLKEGWRTSQRTTSYEKNFTYRMIVRFFNDEDSDYSPFSLHELVRIGESCGKKAGDWYGPTTVSHTLRKAVNETSHPALETICVYVAQDCTVYKEDVMRLSTKCKNCYNPSCNKKFWRSVLILVPVRLGSESLNPIYIPCLQALLTLDYCVGVVGGRPKHSVYFVGFQENQLIHLDPHYLQDKVDMTTDKFPVDSFRCQYPKKMSFDRMDPSCAIGFYCRTREDFQSFCKQAKDILFPPLQHTEYPMFIFDEGSKEEKYNDFFDGDDRGMGSNNSSRNNFVNELLYSTYSPEKKASTSNNRTSNIDNTIDDFSFPSQLDSTSSTKPKTKKHKRKHKKKEKRRAEEGNESPVEDYVMVD